MCLYLESSESEKVRTLSDPAVRSERTDSSVTL